MKRRLSMIVLAGLLGGMLAGCDEQPKKGTELGSSDTYKKGETVQYSAIASDSTGFVIGDKSAPKTIFVFYDTQCPHCAHLWEMSQTLITEPGFKGVAFKWIPVGFLGRASYAQGATILADADPVAKMTEHEKAFNSTKGIKANMDYFDKYRPIIEKNTLIANTLMNPQNNGVPLIVGLNLANGTPVLSAGAPQSIAAFKALIGY